MSNMPDGYTRPSSYEENLKNARDRYQQAIRNLSPEDHIDAALRQELEQTISRIDHKLAQIASRRAYLARL